MRNENKGITIIALIVTIIVLVIIAGVTLAALTGDNGVLRKTNSAKTTNIESTAREQVELGCGAIRLAIAEASAKDNSYSAKANSDLIQDKLLDTLNADRSGLNGSFTNGGVDAGKNQDSFTIVYAGEDYSNATNNPDAKIKYTIELTQKSIEFVSEKTGESFNVTISSSNESAGTVSFTGEYIGTSIELKTEKEVSFRLNIIDSSIAFEGWYIGDTLVSTETSASYKVSTDTNIVARFELVAGLYQTGSNYTVLSKSWNDLVSEGILTSNGKIVSGKEADLAGDLVISNALTTMPESALYNCSSLTSVKISEGITSIEGNAFYGCSNISKIVIPEGISSFGRSAFEKCDNLKDVYYEGDVEGWVQISVNSTSVYSSPLYGEANLYFNNELVTNLVIPESVTTIKGSVFSGCSSLVSVEISEGVTSIGQNSFADCKNLESIKIPNSLKSMSRNAFISSRNIKDVYYAGNLDGWLDITFGTSSANPLNYGANLCFNNELVTDVLIPEGETSIGYAFTGCTSLTSIKIPEGVTSIGDHEFENCTSLNSVEIPQSVTKIYDWAFARCENLESIEIPESVTSLGDSVFYSCINLKTVNIPQALNTLPTQCFSNCSSLESITISKNITTIGSRAFSGCKSLKKVYYDGTINDWCDISGNSSPCINGANLYVSGVLAEDIEILDGITEINAVTFEGCTSIKSVKIPEGVTSIGNNAFHNCSNLSNIQLPSTITEINERAFWNCSNLKSITFQGTMEEWKAITFGTYWNRNTGSYIVTCTDGTITK